MRASVFAALKSEQHSLNPSEGPDPPDNRTDCSGITVFARCKFLVDLNEHPDFGWFRMRIPSTVQFAFQNDRMNVSACEHADPGMRHLLPKIDIGCVSSTCIPDEVL
jgi:hypothetical protein